MPSIDMPLEQLRQYKPALYREPDFDSFWQTTLQASRSQPLQAEFKPYDLPTRGVACYSVRYEGFEGGRIAGWYLRPQQQGRFPGLCVYHGYSGRGTMPLDLLPFASQGMCVLSMDCRGQNGLSQDTSVVNEGQHSGWMTKGIRDPKTYYYRYVYADAVRALELLAQREEVDPARLAITGGSQGGGISLAVSALSDRPILSLPDIPFLCDFPRAVSIAANGPYPEIVGFCKAFPDLHEQAMRTLSYFDCMNLAPRIKCRTVISNGLWDDICPPSTIFGAYHHISATKQMEVYPFHKHEIPPSHAEKKFRILMETFN